MPTNFGIHFARYEQPFDEDEGHHDFSQVAFVPPLPAEAHKQVADLCMEAYLETETETETLPVSRREDVLNSHREEVSTVFIVNGHYTIEELTSGLALQILGIIGRIEGGSGKYAFGQTLHRLDELLQEGGDTTPFYDNELADVMDV